jgi:tetratricopeptide (TPR) repeat protein
MHLLHPLLIAGSNFNIWQNVIQIEAELNEMDSVKKHSEQALEFFPNQASLYYYLGTANLILQLTEDAVDAFEQGKKLATTNLPLLGFINGQLGDAYNTLKEHKKSDEAYEAALNIDPNNDHVLNNYSYFLSLRQEKLELAKKMSAKLIKRNPDNPTFLDTHAWVLYQLGEYGESAKIMERALKTGDARGTLLEHYGDILFKLGRVEEAVIQWKKAKGMDDSSDLIDKKIADRKLYEN